MHIIGRRDFLARMGLGAGAYLLAPLFRRRLLPEALGARVPGQKRFIVITNSNGFRRDPSYMYEASRRSETDFDFSFTMEPLAPFKDKLILADQFFNPHDRALHGNQWATLSVMPSENQTGQKVGPPGGISIDRFLAKHIGQEDPFPSTAVGIAEGGKKVRCVSADGKRQPFPAIGNPVAAFDTYFGTTSESGQVDTDAAAYQDRSILAIVGRDARRMRSHLGAPEAAKLDQYLESLAGLENQLGRLNGARADCKPGEPPPSEANSNTLRPAVVSGHVDVTFAAHQCGLTRISHISILGKEAPHDGYGWLGDMRGHHETHHAGDHPTIRKIDNYVMSTVARMAGKLKAVPEGNGTMLDNTVLLYVNSCGGEHHAGQDTHAVVILGGGGGALKTAPTGRYVQVQRKVHCISDVFISLIHAMGVTSIQVEEGGDNRTVAYDKFGDEKFCKGPMSELLA